MEKKDFKKGQKAILLSLKNVDFRKTMDIDAATGECTVVKVGRKYITVEDSHGWEIRFDMENNFEEVDDSFSYTRSELYLSKEDAKKVLERRYLIKAIEKSLHDMSWSTFDRISDQALQNLHTALIAVEKERIVYIISGESIKYISIGKPVSQALCPNGSLCLSIDENNRKKNILFTPSKRQVALSNILVALEENRILAVFHKGKDGMQVNVM